MSLKCDGEARPGIENAVMVKFRPLFLDKGKPASRRGRKAMALTSSEGGTI